MDLESRVPEPWKFAWAKKKQKKTHFFGADRTFDMFKQNPACNSSYLHTEALVFVDFLKDYTFARTSL